MTAMGEAATKFVKEKGSLSISLTVQGYIHLRRFYAIDGHMGEDLTVIDPDDLHHGLLVMLGKSTPTEDTP